MKYPFGFTIVIIDTYSSIDHTTQYRRESGMGLAESYAEACKYLESYYGEDLVCIKYLELYAENEIILLPEGTVHGYAETDFGYEGTPCDAKGNPLEPQEV